MMPPQLDEVPPPPRGPGVLAPFAAPPRDRDLRGLWWTLGIGGLVAVLCCVGGIVGIGFLIPYANSLGQAQVAAVVEDYLTAVRDEDYATARRQLCDTEARTHTVGWFEDHYDQNRVTDFTVNADDVRITDQIVVPARVEQGGTWTEQEYLMQQNGTRYVICGGLD
ncbi:Rv0361 family membrane protein [Dactylosporangium sp. CA-092794]|uniref:Rv0361 family membrane protein n=1 Tax=Dactylosporangium sp. CA-092794 TaxID=3239929 RepID=UPI003D8DD6CA